MDRLLNGVEWCGTYEVHYCTEPKSRAPVEGPIAVYFPLSGETWSSRFIPTSGLIDRTSDHFDPKARPLSKFSDRDRFAVSERGILCSNPHITGLTGIVERLLETGALFRVFTPCEPPLVRWENVDLIRLELTASLSSYCAALREKFVNGFVDCRMYSIATGELEDAVFTAKRYWATPTQFLEIFRHPTIKADLGIADADEQLLISRENWTHYSPFLFSGYLAQTLAYGGAYSHFPTQLDVPLALAEEVFKDLNRDFQNFEFHCCRKPWCSRFFDIAWDHTWIIFDQKLRRLIALLGSDTD